MHVELVTSFKVELAESSCSPLHLFRVQFLKNKLFFLKGLELAFLILLIFFFVCMLLELIYNVYCVHFYTHIVYKAIIQVYVGGCVPDITPPKYLRNAFCFACSGCYKRMDREIQGEKILAPSLLRPAWKMLLLLQYLFFSFHDCVHSGCQNKNSRD